ncbi:MAG: 4Fe-4S binding protein, partial [Cyclobacteriaceae bacterium]|nr:4Fe-4S binding protein [Cyclobacteriaceae bacterium]
DVSILLVVLSLTTWFILKKRSRRYVLYTSIFTLLYFGFYREGCICSIGSIQNVSLSLADPNYSISLTTLAFFMLPLFFALFFGRVFCGGACPLGAIQDLIIIKPIALPVGIRRALGLIPYIYLGLAVLYAVTQTDFIICRYDPFVGIFRMDASFPMLILGGSFLVIGMFVGRPYCRFLCPYGVLLSWMSSVSKKHLTITPTECVDCKLCEHSCPMDTINVPVTAAPPEKRDRNLFLISALLVPVCMLVGGYIVSSSHVFLSKANHTVALAELMITNPELKDDIDHIDVQTFLASGQTMDELVVEASAIREQYKTGGWFLGGFLGLAFAIIFTRKTLFRGRGDYQPDKINCVSCARCMDYCPVGKPDFDAIMSKLDGGKG